PETIAVQNLSVLIVDDNATNRRLLEELLATWQMRSTAVEDGKAALAALKRAHDANDPFSLVLLDSQMPGMDGFTLAQHIKDSPDVGAPIVMMLTSAAQLGDAARCEELGIAAHL